MMAQLYQVSLSDVVVIELRSFIDKSRSRRSDVGSAS